MLQPDGLRAIHVATGNLFYGGEKKAIFQTCSGPANLISLYCLMRGTLSTYKCGLAEAKFLFHYWFYLPLLTYSRTWQ